jgi:chromosome segregation ATPase
MADDSIKYRDIIEPDDSIERLIKQLEELNTTFGQAMSGIKGGAAGLSKSMKAASGATAEGRKELDLAAVAADRLNRAYNELEIAMSDTGREIAQVKAATSDANKASVAQMRQLDAVVGSYDKLKSELKEATTLFKSLSAAERASEGMGKALIDEILRLKNEVKALDDSLKPHIQRLTAVEQAEQKLSFLMSEQGQRYLELQKRIREVTAARKEQKAVVTPLMKAHRQLEYAQSEEYLALQKLNMQTQEATRVAKLQAQVAMSAEGSYDRLAAQYELNKIKLNQMTGAERANKEVKDGLEKETFELYQQMRRLQEATGKHTLSVGNYGKAWNGLAFSLQQTVRELPAAAVGFNTFILGISNNIP